ELLRGRRHFLFRGGFLLGICLRFYSIGTVKAGMTAVHLFVHHIAINVGVVNDGLVHVGYGGVVPEPVPRPVAAPVAVSPVAVTIINSAIKTDRRSPVAFIEHVSAIIPAPPRRSPKHTDGWRSDPGARNQIIIAAAPAPVTRSPDVALHRTRRLLVHRQNRRGNVN